MDIGKRIRELREAHDLTITDLAERADLTRNAVSRIELGRRTPGSTTVEKIARGLGVEPGDLYSKKEPVLSGKAEASPELAEEADEERRDTDSLTYWIEYIRHRAQAIEQQAEMKENPFLADWKTAAKWESMVSQETLDLIQATEEVARPLMERGTAHGEEAQELQRLEDAYKQLQQSSQKVTARALEPIAGTLGESMDRAIEEAIAQVNEGEALIKKKFEDLRIRVT